MIIEKIIQTYQENTLDLIKHQPYQLLEDILKHQCLKMWTNCFGSWNSY